MFSKIENSKKSIKSSARKNSASARRPPVLRPGDLWGSFRDVIRPERPSRARTPRHVHVSAREKARTWWKSTK